jgi:hypothetical protein
MHATESIDYEIVLSGISRSASTADVQAALHDRPDPAPQRQNDDAPLAGYAIVSSSLPLTTTGVPVGQRPDCHRGHLALVAGEDLVVDGPVAMRPTGLPEAVRGTGFYVGGQVALAELVGGRFELARPHRSVLGDEDVGGLPVHSGSGPPRGGLCA